ncbi:MAG TPA: FeoB small GTPase domain-containing protein, partial [Gammaproteobacteria bacterium]|nr:FeoB small GTPase domain-containing protein [Gammaproteobacteria bacterium]
MASTIAIPVESLTISQNRTVALVGNPNSGKSTVFNRLTGLRQKTANYPGVTVEKRVGRLQLDRALVDLIDLPGTYALSPGSDDERIAVDVLLGRVTGTPRPDAVLAVVDVTRLYQSLYLLEQLTELGRPLVVALTMTDAAIRRNIDVDTARLSQLLGGVRVCTIVATTGRGMSALREALTDTLLAPAPAQPVTFWPALREVAESIAAEIGDLKTVGLTLVEIERALVDDDAVARAKIAAALGSAADARIAAARHAVCGDEPPLAAEARARYRWIREILPQVQTSATAPARVGTRI